MSQEPEIWTDSGHDRRVAQLSVEIGMALGLPPEEQDVLERAGLLHDIGKLGIPREILMKRGPLSPAEWRVMRTHPELGLSILGVTGRFTRELLAVLHHHERMDGTGYPHGLVGEEIPIEARIVAVADTFDVLTSDRPYRRAFNQARALRRVLDESGPHLDPVVVEALVKTLVLGPLVQHVA